MVWNTGTGKSSILTVSASKQSHYVCVGRTASHILHNSLAPCKSF